MEILAAPYSNTGVIASHINILRHRLHPDKKSLHLGASKILPGALQEIAVDELASATDTDFPAVAALGYAVAALTEWEYQKPGSKPSFVNGDYDIFNYDP
jgi:hypothetical protein